MDVLALILLGLAAGTLGSMLGLGGGFLVVPALILLKGLDFKIAAGTSIAVIVPAMITALWRHGSAGNVQVSLAAWMAIGAVSGAFLGSWLAGQIDGVVLRRVFAALLVVLAVMLVLKKDEPAVAPAGGAVSAIPGPS